MRIFISAGEPSGDLHGANLVRALRRLKPDIECVGFGGERMRSEGCRLLYPLTELAVMWFARVLANGHVFLRLLSEADRFFAHHRPDAVVLIDYPGFHWWLARRAHFHGIPVSYFVPPQLWGWAGWRVRKMRRWVDQVLCALPFEESWYRQRGVRADYIGHPYFDELLAQHVDPTFLSAQRARGETVIALLPGSRSQEVTRNLSTLIRAAMRIHAIQSQTRFLVACFKPAHQQAVEAYLKGRGLSYIEPHTGRTPEIIHLAHSCIAVSGSVGLELLYHGKPSVIVYRIRPLDLFLCRFFKATRYISLVNLLADKELYPEYLTDRCEAEGIAGHVLRWLNDRTAYEGVRGELAKLRVRVAEPGACERAARHVLQLPGLSALACPPGKIAV
ncbi:MAG TPA: lipid-A-disaccharide synthase [Gemmataceae bacterium]|nr:lipid-A-disaccharide synthase [Gemmataceae bacterium]